jgi:phosphatidylserine decarboxylase
MRVAKEGHPFIIGCAAAGGLFLFLAQATGWWAMGWLAAVGFLLAFYCAYFFRDPPRTVPADDRYVLSPADGKLLEIIQVKDPAGDRWLIRIFLSIFDPHLQRAPRSGNVKAIKYTAGKFLDARHPQAHFDNEQNSVEIASQANGQDFPITVIQIAGLIARRIVCWAKQGQPLSAGQQYGLIRFGSQVDISFPASAKIKVQAGQRVKAGETVLAEV